MSLARYEQETIINFNEGEDTASVYTHNRTLIHRLERLAQDHPEECYLVNAYPVLRAVGYYIPKWWVKVNPPRQLSEEQRAAVSARLNGGKLRQKTPTAQGVSDGPAAPEGTDMSQDPDSEKEA